MFDYYCSECWDSNPFEYTEEEEYKFNGRKMHRRVYYSECCDALVVDEEFEEKR